MAHIKFEGVFEVTCRDRRGCLLWHRRIKNGVTTGGLNDLLAAFFQAGTQRPSWYLGLIDATGYTGVSVSDTLSSHPGWSELTSYTLATRPQWTPLTLSSALLAATAAQTFTLSSAASVKGLLVASDSTKGGTSGILWSTGLFPNTRVLLATQVLTVHYSVRASGGG